MKRWYIVQVFTGYEDLVRIDLEKRIVEEDMQELFGEVIVPTGSIVNGFSADAATQKEKIFPGYVLVNMEDSSEGRRVVLSVPRVSRFLGGASPMPLKDDEFARISSQMKGEISLAREQSSFVIGNEVHVNQGPFAGFLGIVEQIDEEHERLTVMVSIFGRLTPIEIGFDQVDRS